MLSVIRLLIVAILGFSLYYFWPVYSPTLQAFASQPQVVLQPIAEKINQVLPEKLKLPTAQKFLEDKYQQSPEMQSLTEDLKNKATEAAQIEIDRLKKVATDQFCNALLEKIKTECGQ